MSGMLQGKETRQAAAMAHSATDRNGTQSGAETDVV